MRNGKKVPKERPYYPGYIMIEANLVGEIPHIIKNIPGVISFLSLTKGGDPVPMRKAEVNKMLGRMDELSEFAQDAGIPYTVGENVKVIDGSFNGFNGTIEKSTKTKETGSYGSYLRKKDSTRTKLHAGRKELRFLKYINRKLCFRFLCLIVLRIVCKYQEQKLSIRQAV